jgi:hypothetical protein
MRTNSQVLELLEMIETTTRSLGNDEVDVLVHVS